MSLSFSECYSPSIIPLFGALFYFLFTWVRLTAILAFLFIKMFFFLKKILLCEYMGNKFKESWIKLELEKKRSNPPVPPVLCWDYMTSELCILRALQLSLVCSQAVHSMFKKSLVKLLMNMNLGVTFWPPTISGKKKNWSIKSKCLSLIYIMAWVRELGV